MVGGVYGTHAREQKFIGSFGWKYSRKETAVKT
jgi:hypothetical protein